MFKHDFDVSRIVSVGFIILPIGSLCICCASKKLVFSTLKITNFEIRFNIIFLTKLDWKAVRVIGTLQMGYLDSPVCKVVVYEWIKCFKKSREQLEDEPWEKETLSLKKSRKHQACAESS